jgi:hypothetical protein
VARAVGRTFRVAPTTVIALLAASTLALACAGAQVPTPLASLGIPTELPSVDTRALCDATSETDADLQAVGAAAAAAAQGGGFDLENAEQRVDDLVASLEGLPATSEVATVRDAAVRALRDLRGELPNPSTDTDEAVSRAIDQFRSARDALCT